MKKILCAIRDAVFSILEAMGRMEIEKQKKGGGEFLDF
jgi:hypothetical protein